MSSELKKAQEEFKQGRFKECLATVDKAIEYDQTNKNLYLMKASCQSNLQQYSECFTTIEQGQKLLKIPGEDDKLLYNFISIGNEVANKMLEKATAKTKGQAIQNKITYQKQLVDFFERKERWDKFIEEANNFTALLIQEDKYDQVETINLKIFQNQNLPSDIRHRSGISIFSIPSYYKLKTQLTHELLKEIISLNPESQENQLLAERMLKDFDKRQNFTFYSRTPQDLPQFLEESKSYLDLSTQLYLKQDLYKPDVVLSLLTKQLQSFFKYLITASIVYEMPSNEWKDIISMLKVIKESQQFKDIFLDPNESSTYPLFTLIQIMIDCDEQIYSVGGKLYLDSLDPFIKERELERIKRCIDQRYTPLANLFLVKYFTLKLQADYLLQTGENLDQARVKIDEGLRYLTNLKQNGFILGHEWSAKLHILRCKLLISKKIEIEQGKKANEFQQSIDELKVLKNASSNFALINSQVPKLNYQFKLSIDDWKGAKLILDDLDSAGEMKSQLDWLKSERAWLTYSYIDQLAETQEDKLLFLEAIVKLLKDALQSNPKNTEVMVRLGTIYFSYDKELKLASKQDAAQWLSALKIDQANPEIFLCLGIYYSVKEKDSVRALKCIEKALLLRPTLEEAQLLQFKMLVQQTNFTQAFENLEKFSKKSPLSIFPYYFLGLKMQNEGEYDKAIDLYMKTARFHSIWVNTKDKTKPNYPNLQQAFEQAGEKTFLSQPLGIFSQNGIQIWLNITECYLKLDKVETTVKCRAKVFKDLTKLLEGQALNKEKVQLLNNDQVQKLKEFLDKMTQQVLYQQDLEATFNSIQTFMTKNPSSILFKDLQYLVLVSAQVSFKERNYLQSLKHLNFGLSLLTDQKFLEDYEALIIENIKTLVETSIGSKQDSQQILKSNYVQRLKEIVHFGVSNQESLRIKRVLSESYKVLAEELKDHQYLLKAIEIMEGITSSQEIPDREFNRQQKLDLAKLYHFESLIFNKDTHNQRKIAIIRELLKEQPKRVDYWVYFGIFTPDDNIKLKAYYKALSIDPQTQDLTKSFKIMNHLRNVESLNAFIIAVQVLLSARLALEDTNHLISPEKKKRFLQDAISLGEMFLEIEQERMTEEGLIIDQRVDIHQFLSNQIYYIVTMMQYENQDSQISQPEMQELFLSQLQQSPNKDLIIKMLLKSKLQSQAFQSIQELQDYINVTIQTNKLKETQVIENILQTINNINSIQEKQLSSLCQNQLDQLISQPTNENALRLIIVQQQALSQNIQVPSNLFFASDQNQVDDILSSISQEYASKLINQSLRLLFNQLDGDMIQVQQYFDLLHKYRLPQLKQNLPPLEYGKIFKLYLLNQDTFNRQLFIKEYKRIQMAQKHNKHINEFMTSILNKQEFRILMSKQSEVIKHPRKLAGYNELIWSHIRDGELEQADKVILIANQKIKAKIIDIYTPQDLVQLQDYALILDALQKKNPKQIEDLQTIDQSLRFILKAFIQLTSFRNKTSDKQASINAFVQNLNQWLSQFSYLDEIQEDQQDLVYSIFEKLILQHGFIQSFNDIGQEILNSIQTDAAYQNINPFFVEEFYLYLHFNMSNNSVALKKMAQANKIITELKNLMKNQTLSKDAFSILQLTLKLKVKNLPEAQTLLNQIQDEDSYERNILAALLLYEQKKYKNFYLACMELVTSLKLELQSLTSSFVSNKNVQISRLSFLLGYAYYQKAIAEYTFYQARKRNIKLEEDFNEKEEQVYNAETLKRKALKDWQKSKNLLKEYKNVIQFLETQFSDLQ